MHEQPGREQCNASRIECSKQVSSSGEARRLRQPPPTPSTENGHVRLPPFQTRHKNRYRLSTSQTGTPCELCELCELVTGSTIQGRLRRSVRGRRRYVVRGGPVVCFWRRWSTRRVAILKARDRRRPRKISDIFWCELGKLRLI